MGRYFVTGATGFLGGELTKQLISRGHQRGGAGARPGPGLAPADARRRDPPGRRHGPREPPRPDGRRRRRLPLRRLVQDRRRPGDDAERINVDGHAPCARGDVRAGRSRRASTPAPWRCSRTRGARCPTSATATTDRTCSEYDRTKWLAHYEVALPMMARGPAAGHRAAGRHLRARATPAGCTPRWWTCCASACRSRRGAPRSAGRTSRTPRAATSWRWSAARPARPTSSPARATPSRTRSIWWRRWPRSRGRCCIPDRG